MSGTLRPAARRSPSMRSTWVWCRTSLFTASSPTSIVELARAARRASAAASRPASAPARVCAAERVCIADARRRRLAGIDRHREPHARGGELRVADDRRGASALIVSSPIDAAAIASSAIARAYDSAFGLVVGEQLRQHRRRARCCTRGRVGARRRIRSSRVLELHGPLGRGARRVAAHRGRDGGHVVAHLVGCSRPPRASRRPRAVVALRLHRSAHLRVEGERNRTRTSRRGSGRARRARRRRRGTRRRTGRPSWRRAGRADRTGPASDVLPPDTGRRSAKSRGQPHVRRDRFREVARRGAHDRVRLRAAGAELVEARNGLAARCRRCA